jgi:hypothetical protein
MVLVSIIIGLGITTLLSGSVNAFRADSPTRPGLVHSLWVLYLLNSHVATWLIRWNAAGRIEWAGLEVLAFLILPILLFASAKLIFPSESYASDLTTYFLENRRPFFSLIWLIVVASSFGPYLFFNVAEIAAELGGPASLVSTTISVLVALVVCLVLAWFPNRKLHLAFAILAAIFGFAQLLSPVNAISP